MKQRDWGIAAAHDMGLDVSQYSMGGKKNIHQTGENGWYQGKAVVNAKPLTFEEFFIELPKCVRNASVTKNGRIVSNIGLQWLMPDVLTECRRLFLKCHKRGGRIIFIGNGGSSAIASHMAIDFTKNGGIRAIAFNDAPTLTCLANDFGYDNVFAKQLDYYATSKDIVVIISSSGKSGNIIEAAKHAVSMGCKTITFSGMNPNNKLRALGDINFWVPSADYGIVELTHLTILHSIASVSLPEEATSLIHAYIRKTCKSKKK